MCLLLRLVLTLCLTVVFLPSPLARATSERVIKVGVFQFEPAIFKAEDGTVRGLFADLLAEIGRRENIRFEYVFGSWQQGLERLKSGEIDLVTSAAFSEERADFMDFGQQPLLTVWSELYVHKDSEVKGIQGLLGETVAVMQEDYNGANFVSLIKQFGIECKFLEVPDFKSVLQAIEDKRVTAGVVSVVVGALEGANYSVKPTGFIFNPFNIYFATPKGKGRELLALLDKYLQRWRGDAQSIYFKKHEQWFYEKLVHVDVISQWEKQVAGGILVTLLIAIVFIMLLRRKVRQVVTELEQSESRFRKAILKAPIPIMMHAEDGEIIVLSESWCRISGYPAESLLTTRDWTSKAYGDDNDEILAEINHLYSLEEEKQEGDYVIQCSDGSYRVWAFSSVTVGNLPDGRCLVVSIASDVTDRLKREQELALSQNKYQQLFEQMQSGFALHEIICNEEGEAIDYRFLLANKSFEGLTGLSAENIIGKTASMIFPDLEDYWLEHYGKAAIDGIPVEFEAYSKFFDKFFAVRTFPTGSGQFAVLLNDISEKKLAEQERIEFIAELEANNIELERISYTISHDLKTPLVTVLNFIEYLEADLAASDAEKVARDIAYVKNAAHKMSKLLNELLEFTRLGRIDEKPVEMNYSDVIDDVLSQLAGPLQTHRVEVICSDQELPLFAEPLRLAEVWQSLLENAVKYMGGQTAPQINVGFERVDDEIVFYVKDNGIGVEDQYHDKIFQLFEKLESSVDGTGIGLALAKRMVTLHQGRIWVESAGLGCGACFRFTLPLAVERVAKGTINE